MPSPYGPQRDLSDLTERQSRPARLLQGIVLIEFAWMFLGSVWITLWEPLVELSQPTRLAAFVSFLTHAVLWAAVAGFLRLLQDRRIPALIGAPGRAARDFLDVLTWAGGIAMALQVWDLAPFIGDPEVVQPLAPWLLTLPLMAAAIFVQTTAEELYFRGYIQSTLAARFQHPAIWMGLPSLFFGLVHIEAGAPTTEALQIVLYTGAFGLACADLTARSGTLGAAIAFHFAHNAALALTFGTEGSPDAGFALFVFPAMDKAATGPLLSLDLLVWLLILLILWLAARNALRR